MKRSTRKNVNRVFAMLLSICMVLGNLAGTPIMTFAAETGSAYESAADGSDIAEETEAADENDAAEDNGTAEDSTVTEDGTEEDADAESDRSEPENEEAAEGDFDDAAEVPKEETDIPEVNYATPRNEGNVMLFGMGDGEIFNHIDEEIANNDGKYSAEYNGPSMADNTFVVVKDSYHVWYEWDDEEQVDYVKAAIPISIRVKKSIGNTVPEVSAAGKNDWLKEVRLMVDDQNNVPSKEFSTDYEVEGRQDPETVDYICYLAELYTEGRTDKEAGQNGYFDYNSTNEKIKVTVNGEDYIFTLKGLVPTQNGHWVTEGSAVAVNKDDVIELGMAGSAVPASTTQNQEIGLFKLNTEYFEVLGIDEENTAAINAFKAIYGAEAVYSEGVDLEGEGLCFPAFTYNNGQDIYYPSIRIKKEDAVGYVEYTLRNQNTSASTGTDFSTVLTAGYQLKQEGGKAYLSEDQEGNTANSLVFDSNEKVLKFYLYKGNEQVTDENKEYRIAEDGFGNRFLVDDKHGYYSERYNDEHKNYITLGREEGTNNLYIAVDTSDMYMDPDSAFEFGFEVKIIKGEPENSDWYREFNFDGNCRLKYEPVEPDVVLFAIGNEDNFNYVKDDEEGWTEWKDANPGYWDPSENDGNGGLKPEFLASAWQYKLGNGWVDKVKSDNNAYISRNSYWNHGDPEDRETMTAMLKILASKDQVAEGKVEITDGSKFLKADGIACEFIGEFEGYNYYALTMEVAEHSLSDNVGGIVIKTKEDSSVVDTVISFKTIVPRYQISADGRNWGEWTEYREDNNRILMDTDSYIRFDIAGSAMDGLKANPYGNIRIVDDDGNAILVTVEDEGRPGWNYSILDIPVIDNDANAYLEAEDGLGRIYGMYGDYYVFNYPTDKTWYPTFKVVKEGGTEVDIRLFNEYGWDIGGARMSISNIPQYFFRQIKADGEMGDVLTNFSFVDEMITPENINEVSTPGSDYKLTFVLVDGKGEPITPGEYKYELKEEDWDNIVISFWWDNRDTRADGGDVYEQEIYTIRTEKDRVYLDINLEEMVSRIGFSYESETCWEALRESFIVHAGFAVNMVKGEGEDKEVIEIPYYLGLYHPTEQRSIVLFGLGEAEARYDYIKYEPGFEEWFDKHPDCWENEEEGIIKPELLADFMQYRLERNMCAKTGMYDYIADNANSIFRNDNLVFYARVLKSLNAGADDLIHIANKEFQYDAEWIGTVDVESLPYDIFRISIYGMDEDGNKYVPDIVGEPLDVSVKYKEEGSLKTKKFELMGMNYSYQIKAKGEENWPKEWQDGDGRVIQVKPGDTIRFDVGGCVVCSSQFYGNVGDVDTRLLKPNELTEEAKTVLKEYEIDYYGETYVGDNGVTYSNNNLIFNGGYYDKDLGKYVRVDNRPEFVVNDTEMLTYVNISAYNVYGDGICGDRITISTLPKFTLRYEKNAKDLIENDGTEDPKKTFLNISDDFDGVYRFYLYNGEENVNNKDYGELELRWPGDSRFYPWAEWFEEYSAFTELKTDKDGNYYIEIDLNNEENRYILESDIFSPYGNYDFWIYYEVQRVDSEDYWVFDCGMYHEETPYDLRQYGNEGKNLISKEDSWSYNLVPNTDGAWDANTILTPGEDGKIKLYLYEPVYDDKTYVTTWEPICDALLDTGKTEAVLVLRAGSPTSGQIREYEYNLADNKRVSMEEDKLGQKYIEINLADLKVKLHEVENKACTGKDDDACETMPLQYTSDDYFIQLRPQIIVNGDITVAKTYNLRYSPVVVFGWDAVTNLDNELIYDLTEQRLPKVYPYDLVYIDHKNFYQPDGSVNLYVRMYKNVAPENIDSMVSIPKDVNYWGIKVEGNWFKEVVSVEEIDPNKNFYNGQVIDDDSYVYYRITLKGKDGINTMDQASIVIADKFGETDYSFASVFPQYRKAGSNDAFKNVTIQDDYSLCFVKAPDERSAVIVPAEGLELNIEAVCDPGSRAGKGIGVYGMVKDFNFEWNHDFIIGYNVDDEELKAAYDYFDANYGPVYYSDHDREENEYFIFDYEYKGETKRLYPVIWINEASDTVNKWQNLAFFISNPRHDEEENIDYGWFDEVSYAVFHTNTYNFRFENGKDITAAKRSEQVFDQNIVGNTDSVKLYIYDQDGKQLNVKDKGIDQRFLGVDECFELTFASERYAYNLGEASKDIEIKADKDGNIYAEVGLNAGIWGDENAKVDNVFEAYDFINNTYKLSMAMRIRINENEMIDVAAAHCYVPAAASACVYTDSTERYAENGEIKLNIAEKNFNIDLHNIDLSKIEKIVSVTSSDEKIIKINKQMEIIGKNKEFDAIIAPASATIVKGGSCEITIEYKLKGQDKSETIKFTATVEGGCNITYKLASATDPTGEPVLVPDKDCVMRGETVVLPKMPEYMGYTFKWYSDSKYTTEYDAKAPVNGNITIYGKWNPIEYTIRLMPQKTGGSLKIDGTMADITGVTYGKEVKLPKNKFTCSDMHFVAWEDVYGNRYLEDETVINLATSEEEKVVELYAVWAKDVYTISYGNVTVGEGGVVANDNPITYTGGEATILNAPVRPGYTFKGWYYDKDCSKEVADNTITGQTGNLVLYAAWSINETTIIFDGNKEYISKNVIDSFKGSTKNQTVKFDKPAKLNAVGYKVNGYQFAGWNTKADGTGDAYANKEVYSVSETGSEKENVTLYAQWAPIEYKITYTDAIDGKNGVTNSENPAVFTVEDETITLKNPERVGYTFGGWFTKKKFNDSSYLTTTVSTNTPKAQTVYACWKPYKTEVTFAANAPAGLSATKEMKALNAEFPKTRALTANTYKFKDYVFTGWNTKADGTGTYYADKAPIELSFYGEKNSVTKLELYAQWKKAPKKITYANAVNGIDGVSGNDNVLGYDDGTDKNITLSTTVTRIGYTFGGWYYDKACKKKVENNNLITTGKDMSVYANWIPDETMITFDSNKPVNATSVNVTGNTKPLRAIYGKTKTLNNNAYKLKGYQFAGWNTQADGRGIGYTNKEAMSLDLIQSGKLTSGADAVGKTYEITLYAQWKPVKYKIVYNNAVVDGKDVVANNNIQEFTLEYDVIAAKASTDVTSTLKEYVLSNPVRTGYDFVGWYTDKKCKKPFISFVTASNMKTVNLYAKWKPKTYTLKFDPNLPEKDSVYTGSMADQTATYDRKMTLNANRYKVNGYVFKGWSTQKNPDSDSILYVNRMYVLNPGNAADGKTVILYAQWEKEK